MKEVHPLDRIGEAFPQSPARAPVGDCRRMPRALLGMEARA
jgi:hypothetical protein